MSYSRREVLRALLLAGSIGSIFQPATFAEQESRRHSEVRELWLKSEKQLRQRISQSFASKNPYVLYDLQIATHSMRLYSQLFQDFSSFKELLNLMALSWQYLAPYGSREAWVNSSGKEVILVSSQFLFLVCQCLRQLAETPGLWKNENAERFVSDASRTVKAHFRDWIFADEGRPAFSVNGWGCRAGDYSHSDFINLKLKRDLGKRVSYCCAVTDVDLFLVASVGELLAANRSRKIFFDDERWLAYYRTGVALVSSRITLSLSKPKVLCADFDPGVWDQHPSYDFAGYQEAKPPAPNDKCRGEGLGWDFSHARRLVQVLPSLTACGARLGLAFDGTRVEQRLANQLVDKVFLQDYHFPQFANFFDGRNGWYRVEFDGQKLLRGHPPSQLSASFLTGGYLEWARFRPEILRIGLRLEEVLKSSDEESRQFCRLYYPGFQRQDSGHELLWMQFITSLLNGQAIGR